MGARSEFSVATGVSPWIRSIGDLDVCTPNLDRCAQAPIRKPLSKEFPSDALTRPAEWPIYVVIRVEPIRERAANMHLAGAMAAAVRTRVVAFGGSNGSAHRVHGAGTAWVGASPSGVRSWFQ